MISYSSCIIPNLAHNLNNQITLKVIKIGSSLKHIARIKKQKIRIFFPRLTDHGCNPDKPALSGKFGVVGRKWVDVAMHIIGVHHGEFNQFSGSK